MGSNLLSTKEELMKLRQVLRHLRPACTESDDTCLLRTTAALWDKWLSLLEAAKEWEIWCEELKWEWKFVSEEVSASFQQSSQFPSKCHLNCLLFSFSFYIKQILNRYRLFISCMHNTYMFIGPSKIISRKWLKFFLNSAVFLVSGNTYKYLEISTCSFGL